MVCGLVGNDVDDGQLSLLTPSHDAELGERMY
jgi:hypothetical protein